MGRAEDDQLRRQVAIKLIQAEYPDPDATCLFQREARAIAMLNHLEDSFTHLRTLEGELTNLRRQGPDHNEQEAEQGHPLHDTEGPPTESTAHPS
jgi:hypothetical protein